MLQEKDRRPAPSKKPCGCKTAARAAMPASGSPPVTRQSWRLRSRGTEVSLEGLEGGTRTGTGTGHHH
jgi:hypothetical protein